MFRRLARLVIQDNLDLCNMASGLLLRLSDYEKSAAGIVKYGGTRAMLSNITANAGKEGWEETVKNMLTVLNKVATTKKRCAKIQKQGAIDAIAAAMTAYQDNKELMDITTEFMKKVVDDLEVRRLCARVNELYAEGDYTNPEFIRLVNVLGALAQDPRFAAIINESGAGQAFLAIAGLMRRYPADKDITDRNVAAAVGASIRALGNLTYADGGVDPSLAVPLLLEALQHKDLAKFALAAIGKLAAGDDDECARAFIRAGGVAALVTFFAH